MSKNISSIKVPHFGPDDAKILFVGEAPGEDEERMGKPFVGIAGQRLRNTLIYYGFNPDNARYANLCNYKPNHNNFNWLWNSSELEEGQQELREWILSHRPNVIVPLGKEALNFLTGKKSIQVWRGSIIPCIISPQIKCIPTLHPSYVERDQNHHPTFCFDIQRILSDSNIPDYNYTKREFIINPTGFELEKWVQFLCNSPKLGCDLESSKKTKQIICYGFAPNPNLCVCIFTDTDAGRRAVARVLESPAEKIFHFGIFDALMSKREGYEINNYCHDTYIGQRIIRPFLPNSLAYLTSIHTREAYYKDEGRAEIPKDTKVWAGTTDKSKLGIYNCKDCCVTIESHLEQIKELEQEGLLHVYEDNMAQQEMAIHISSNGVLIDEERRYLMERALLLSWKKKQDALNFLFRAVINVNSPKLKDWLYGEGGTKLGLPERKKRDKNGTWKVTTDEDALVACITHIKYKIETLKTLSLREEWERKEIICKLIIQIRGIRKSLSSYIKTKDSVSDLYGEDNRARSTYKVGGAETLRYSCEMFVDSTGINGQTFPREAIKIPKDVDSTDFNLFNLIVEVKSDIIAGDKDSELLILDGEAA